MMVCVTPFRNSCRPLIIDERVGAHVGLTWKSVNRVLIAWSRSRFGVFRSGLPRQLISPLPSSSVRSRMMLGLRPANRVAAAHPLVPSSAVPARPAVPNRLRNPRLLQTNSRALMRFPFCMVPGTQPGTRPGIRTVISSPPRRRSSGPAGSCLRAGRRAIEVFAATCCFESFGCVLRCTRVRLLLHPAVQFGTEASLDG